MDLLKDDSLPLVTKPPATPERSIPDSEAAIIKEGRKKYPRVVNLFKDQAYLGVHLIVGKLPASTPAFKKRLTKAISEDEAVRFCGHSFEVLSLTLKRIGRQFSPNVWLLRARPIVRKVRSSPILFTNWTDCASAKISRCHGTTL